MADPPWLPGCIENLKKIPGATLCAVNHCEDSQTYLHAVCHCQAPYSNGCPDPPTAGCCSYTDTSPIILFGPQNCYCCCGCFANNTMIRTDATETKAIQEFIVGDLVYVAMDPELKEWAQMPVQFSSGTGPESSGDMIQIRFGDAEAPEKVVASRNQLFLVAGNKLKRASRLVPSLDSLVRPDGTLAEVRDLTTGTFTGGVHQIATSKLVTTNWAGHLMVANGVVCGDYALQLTNLELAQPDMLVEGHADLPEFGTRAYGERHAHLFSDTLKAYVGDATYADDHAEGFEPLLASVRPKPPEDGTSFVSEVQAQDIEHNAPRQPHSSGAGRDILNYLFRIFGGFYRDITFYLDDANDLPNAYATREYGQAFVIVNGGLIRTNAVQYESLALIIAHQIAVLRASEPKDAQGNTCRGQADYGAILGVFPYVWFGMYAYPMVQPAIQQITALFDFIDPAHRGGVPGNTCNLISIDCRISAMVAASLTAELPECAGGKATPTLAVTGALASTDGLAVTIAFNEAVDVETAGSVGAYAFAPLTPAKKATVAEDALSVLVEADFEPDRPYQVTVLDVLSADGHPLIPSKSSARFKTPPPIGG